jgi:hypothetical protein
MNNAFKHETYPLTPLQEGMLFQNLLSIGTDVNILQIICSIHERLDVGAFQRAWVRVEQRHALSRKITFAFKRLDMVEILKMRLSLKLR